MRLLVFSSSDVLRTAGLCHCAAVLCYLLLIFSSPVEISLACNVYSHKFQRQHFIVDMSHHAKRIRKVNKAFQQHRRQVDKNFPCLVAVAFCTHWAGFTRTAVRSVIQLNGAPDRYPYRQCCRKIGRHQNGLRSLCLVQSHARNWKVDLNEVFGTWWL
jgi:hypothetical protein